VPASAGCGFEISLPCPCFFPDFSLGCRYGGADGANVIYVFDDYSLDIERRELRRGTKLVAVEPQVFDILQYLIAQRERVVSKEDLIDAVWGGRIVSESTLSSRLTAVRHAIGDSGDAQRLIRTIPRKGLRFVGEVAEAADASSVRTLRTTTSAAMVASAGGDPACVAEKIDRDVIAEERKHLTVLCADLKESLELIAERDPEQALRTFDAVLEMMTQAVNRYDGTLNVVTGDGMIALFGVPVAHEDHAVRACYAALQMQDAVKCYSDGPQRPANVAIRVRAGLSSGEVVVRSISRDLNTECRAMGQTTHAAARLAQMAGPGTLLVSSDTLRLAEGHVYVKAHEPSSHNGLGAPVYELVGAGPAQTRFEVLAARGLTGFVGRGAEMEQLARVQARALEGDGQVVTIIGEAGLGKSRLLHEYIRSQRASQWLALETASVSYRQATSYLPVIELLRTYCKIEASDDVREVRDKVTARVLNLDQALLPHLPALLALLDIPVEEPSWHTLEPLQRRQRTLDALKQLILRQARRQPVILAFEDLHWIDSETQAFLEMLSDALTSAPLLLILTYRPEYDHDWGRKSYYTQLRLNALSAEATEEFLRNLLGSDLSLLPLRQLLPKHGNPLFLEESIRTLVETNALDGKRGAYRLVGPLPRLPIAPTVQAILAARIDRLPARGKWLLQAASVIGKDVPHTILEPIAGLEEHELRRGLADLREAEFLYETIHSPDVGYSFKHALTHDVSYRSLLGDQRRLVHRQVVDVIERAYGERLTEHVEQLAHHAVRGELWDKAVQFLRQAGAKAAARSALPEAQIWFEQALGALEALPISQSTLEQAFEIRLDLRPVLTLRTEFRTALERLREAEVFAERLNDDIRRGRVYAFMMNIHTQLGERDDAAVAGRRALKIAERLGDLRLRIITTTYLAQTHYYHGDYERAVELAMDNLATLPAGWVYERFGLPAPASIYARWVLLPSLAHLGRFDETARDEVEAIRLAEPTQHAYTIGETYQAAGFVRLIRGDWTGAHALLEHANAVLRTGNVLLPLPTGLAAAAWALAQLGEEGDALERVREAEQLLENHAARGLLILRRWTYRLLARACVKLGRLDDALRLGNRAVESVPPQTGLAAHTFHLLGDIATHPDRFDAESGESHYLEALALAKPRRMRPLAARCHLGLGTLYQKVGRHEEAGAALSHCVQMFRDMDMTFWLSQAEAELAKTA